MSVPASDPRTLNVAPRSARPRWTRSGCSPALGPEDCVPPPTCDIVEAFPPADLSENGSHASNRPKYESDECLFLFAERQNVTLPAGHQPLGADDHEHHDCQQTAPDPSGHCGRWLPDPRRPDRGADQQRPTPGHVDVPGADPRDQRRVHRSGDRRRAGRARRRSPTTRSPGPSDPRGLEAAHGDSVRVSPTDPNTIIVDLTFSAMDEIRVWTGVIDPPDVCPSGTPILRAYPPADLSLDGADPDTGAEVRGRLHLPVRGGARRPAVAGHQRRRTEDIREHGERQPGDAADPPGHRRQLLPAPRRLPGPSPDPTGTTIGGTWTFDAPILGVSYTLSELKAGETRVGHPAITYEQTASFRGLETGGTDIVRVSPADPNTLIVEFAFNAMDEIRVWTGVIDPPDPCPSGTPILQAFPPGGPESRWRRSRSTSPKYEDACIYLFEEAVDVPLGTDDQPGRARRRPGTWSALPRRPGRSRRTRSSARTSSMPTSPDRARSDRHHDRRDVDVRRSDPGGQLHAARTCWTGDEPRRPPVDHLRGDPAPLAAWRPAAATSSASRRRTRTRSSSSSRSTPWTSCGSGPAWSTRRSATRARPTRSSRRSRRPT